MGSLDRRLSRLEVLTRPREEVRRLIYVDVSTWPEEDRVRFRLAEQLNDVERRYDLIERHHGVRPIFKPGQISYVEVVVPDGPGDVS